MRRFVFLALLTVLLAACQASTPAIIPGAPASLTPENTPALAAEESATAVLSATAVPPATAVQSPTALPASPTSQPSATDTPVPVAETPAAPSASALTMPAAGSADWQLVTGGLNAPIGIANAGDGSARLFVLEQAGVIRIIQDGVLLPDSFLDISGRVGCCGERGLLGLAFHPRYTENGYFYVNYTDQDGNTVIARFQVSPDDPNRADASSEKRLLSVQQPYRNHNGGAVVFGPDGYLYLGLGDGGSAGDPHGNGQSTSTLLGKILRIDVDQGDPYSIPPDNPFANGGGLAEIWAYGLRNPWRIAFDRLTGDLYIGDVGQNAWEEIDFVPTGSPPGVNFGWNYREGTHGYQGSPPQGVDLVEPVTEYGHNQGCSVTGGEVYRGTVLAGWQGVYLFGDYCSGIVWGLLRSADGTWQQSQLYETGRTITSFGLDEAGEIYLTDYLGAVYRLSPAQ